MKNLYLGLVICLMILSSFSCTTYYYIVRHAEKLNNTDDSPLSQVGFQRANILRDSLINKGIDSIFASTKIRTQQTAQPLATALGESFRIYRPDTVNGLITALRKISGREVLVVGHTTNIPQIVQGLSNQSIPNIDEDDFDNLFIIKVRKCLGTKRTLRSTTYGPPSP